MLCACEQAGREEDRSGCKPDRPPVDVTVGTVEGGC